MRKINTILLSITPLITNTEKERIVDCFDYGINSVIFECLNTIFTFSKMKTSIFKTGKQSSFAKTSRRMAKVLALGSGTLAIVYCLFIFYYFDSSKLISIISLCFPLVYLATFLLSFTQITNKRLYEIAFYAFLLTSLSLLYIAYLFSFNSEYIILMMAVFNVILFALPTTKQLLLYFIITFISLEIMLFLSAISLGFSLLISASFGAVFVLSYVISKQKSMLNFHSTQNAKILKTLVNNTKDVIFLVDFVTQEICDANENSKDAFGWEDTDELISKHYFQLFADADFIPSRMSKINQEIEKTGYYQADVMFRRKDNSRFLGRIQLSPFEALDKKHYLIQIKNSTLKKL